MNEAAQSISIFEQWWEAIQPAIKNNSLTFWENLYKEIYMNIIQGDRWLQYIKGLGVTLQVSFFAILLGLVLGTVLAILRLPQVKDYQPRNRNPLSVACGLIVRALSRIAGAYINVIRGTPLLLQVLIINFGIVPAIVGPTVRVEKVLIGVIACGFNSAAYVAEIVRGGIMSVDKGQTEAGRSLGLSSLRTMLYIILPQAAKSALPSMCNEFISLIKETSILSYIALTELTKAGDYIRSRTYSAFTPYIVSGMMYLAVVLTLTWLIGKLERRLRNSDH